MDPPSYTGLFVLSLKLGLQGFAIFFNQVECLRVYYTGFAMVHVVNGFSVIIAMQVHTAIISLSHVCRHTSHMQLSCAYFAYTLDI